MGSVTSLGQVAGPQHLHLQPAVTRADRELATCVRCCSSAPRMAGAGGSECGARTPGSLLSASSLPSCFVSGGTSRGSFLKSSGAGDVGVPCARALLHMVVPFTPHKTRGGSGLSISQTRKLGHREANRLAHSPSAHWWEWSRLRTQAHGFPPGPTQPPGGHFPTWRGSAAGGEGREN